MDRKRPPSVDGTSATRPGAAWWFRSSVTWLTGLVLCCGALLWAWREVEEGSDSVLSEARSTQQQAIVSLATGTTRDRLAAVDTLVGLREVDNSVALGPLSGALEDPDPSVRLAVTRVISQVVFSVLRSGNRTEHLPSAVSSLLDIIKDDQPEIRSAALISLGMISSASSHASVTSPSDLERVIKVLVGSLDDRDAQIRRSAILALLAAYRTTDVPPEVLARGLEDPVVENRLVTIRGLGASVAGLDNAWLLRLYNLALKDPDHSVRAECLEWVSRRVFSANRPAFVPEMIAGLRTKDPRERCKVIGLIRAFESDARPAIPELLRILHDPVELDPAVSQYQNGTADRDPGSQAALALAAIARGTPEQAQVVKELMEVTRSSTLIRRYWAVWALGQFGPTAVEAAPLLIEIVTDSELVRTNSANGRYPGPPEAEAHHLEFLEVVMNSLARVAAGTSAAERSIAVLVPMLESEARAVRSVAVHALALFGPEASTAIPGLCRLLADEVPSVRAAAAEAIATFGLDASVAIAGLRRLLADPDKFVKYTASRSLERIESLQKAANPR